MFRIPSHMNGPPGTGHGGVAAGMFATAIDPLAAEVVLLAPPPLDVDLNARRDGEGIVVAGPDGDVARVRPLDALDVEPFPRLDAQQLAAAADDWAHEVVPKEIFHTCWACGVQRDDGLRLFAGRPVDAAHGGTAWSPDSSMVGDAPPRVASWALWAVMDCPGFGALHHDLVDDERCVLGTYAVDIHRLPDVGDDLQIVTRSRGRTGRRLTHEAAIVADDGENLARARGVWVAVPAGRF